MPNVSSTGKLHGEVGASAAWNYGNAVFVIILGLILSPYQLSELGVDAYGILMLEISFMSLATMVNTALTRSFVILGGRHGNRIWPVAHKIERLAGLSMVAMTMVFANFILPLLSIPEGKQLTAKILLLMLGCAQSLNVFVASDQAKLMLTQRFASLNRALLTGQMFQAVSLVAMFEICGAHLLLNGCAILFGAIVSRGLIWRYSCRQPVSETAETDVTLSRELLSVGISMGGMQVSAVLGIQLLQVTANQFGGASANAVIGILLLLRSAVGRLNDSLANVVFSGLSVAYHNDLASVRVIWLSATRAICLLSMPFVIGCVCMAEPMASVWLGENGVLVVPYLPLVALDLAVPSLALVTVQLLQLGRYRNLQLGFDFGLLALTGATFYLLGYANESDVGSYFMAYAALRSAYGLLLLFGVAPKVVHVGVVEILKKIVVPVFACGAAVAFTVGLVRHFLIQAQPLTELLTAIAVAAGMFIPVTWFLVLKQSERAWLRSIFAGRHIP